LRLLRGRAAWLLPLDPPELPPDERARAPPPELAPPLLGAR
jgi:hypothetical protein